MRVLKWIIDRCHGRIDAQETSLGWVPNPQTFDLEGMGNFTARQFDAVEAINNDEWRREILSQEDLFMQLYSHLPKELIFQRELLMARL
jgi:phosphoenolpyruvate carboxykinase (GTP)